MNCSASSGRAHIHVPRLMRRKITPTSSGCFISTGASRWKSSTR
ncbi:hypothetical protein ACFPFV_08200 [Salinicoccus siamensis]